MGKLRFLEGNLDFSEAFGHCTQSIPLVYFVCTT